MPTLVAHHLEPRTEPLPHMMQGHGYEQMEGVTVEERAAFWAGYVAGMNRAYRLAAAITVLLVLLTVMVCRSL